MKLNEEQKKLKEQLKFEHRDRLVALGFLAYTHAAAQDYSAAKQLASVRAELISLGNSEKYLSSLDIEPLLCNIQDALLDDLKKHHEEINWQIQNIDPGIVQSFRTLRAAEKELKKK